MTFAEFKLPQELLRALADLEIETPTDIQEKAIPVLMAGEKDFVGQAQTGTGKTAAFVLPLLEKIDWDKTSVQCLILAPTRELAHQVFGEIEKLGKYLPVKAATVYGGVAYGPQINSLKRQLPQIVVGTPGRVIDLIDKRILKLDNCHQLIIDEADEMLNMGFLESVETIIDALNDDRRIWMFSATLPARIAQLINRKFSSPEVIRTQNKTLSNQDIDQFYCFVDRRSIPDAIERFIEVAEEEVSGIIFCETREDTRLLSEGLREKSLSATALHGALSQSQRDLAMQQFRDKKVKLMICTDVAARGLDISHITHVINIGLPRNPEAYVHRIGRTGRAGMKGVALTFLGAQERRKIPMIERLTRAKMQPYTLPKVEEVKEQKVKNELGKMDTLKEVLTLKQEEFKTDQSFEIYENYFQDLTKEQALKLLFSHRFAKELKRVEQKGALDQRAPRPYQNSDQGFRRQRGGPKRFRSKYSDNNGGGGSRQKSYRY